MVVAKNTKNKKNQFSLSRIFSAVLIRLQKDDGPFREEPEEKLCLTTQFCGSLLRLVVTLQYAVNDGRSGL